MSVPQKQCPKCRVAMPLDAEFCGGCGHTFRTKFAPPVDTTQQLFPASTPSKSKPLLAVVVVLVGIASLLYIYSYVEGKKRERDAQQALQQMQNGFKQMLPPYPDATQDWKAVEPKSGASSPPSAPQPPPPRSGNSSRRIVSLRKPLHALHLYQQQP